MSETPSTITCPRCEHEVPAAPYCVRCGEWLVDDLSKHPSGKRGFAAAPNESAFSPRLISTIFPQLPRADMDAFRASLALGAAAIIVLALFRLFPLALIGSAVLVPLLVVLYLWDVDLYEDEPRLVLGLTILWGIAAGIGVGFLSKHVISTDAALAFQITTHTLVWSGILIPLISFALMVVGPLPLLPYRKFNDVLDGATFGAATAVAFVGAELLTHSSDFLASGVRPVGATVPWILRLISLGVIVPVLAACAVGAAMGALWLRYRAPVRDRKVLGPLGHPLLALPLAAGLIVGGALIQLYLDTWLETILLLVAALLAILWLRQMIHIGLLQEASEIEIGPPVTCGNCGKQTPRHTFCAYCGVSLTALPKTMRPERPWAERPPRRGEQPA
jgi:hypothetical protein